MTGTLRPWPRRCLAVLAPIVLAVLLGGCASWGGQRDAAPPVAAPALAGEAEAQYVAGDWRAAAQTYERLLAAEPGNAEAWFRLANARARADDPDGAVAAYREVLARDASYTKAAFNLGLVQVREAAESFASLAEADAADPALRAQAARLRDTLAVLLQDLHAGGAAAPPDTRAPGESP